ncbi:MAG: 50S ribosomal protein L15 [Candidatus Omnitrophota bacterium]
MKIQDIRRPKGANRPPKRVGRGSGSGHGKTSGRGSKGAGQRKGASLRIGFEGGQMPLLRRVPKRGFTNVAKKVYQIVNVERLNHFRKDSSVDNAAMREAGLVKKAELPVKILGDGKISKPLNVRSDAFSRSAKKKITEAGGKAEIKKC